jgi:hypothetical protein
MALTRWGFVYTVGPEDPIRRDDIGSDGCRLIAVGVPSTELAAVVCVELADDGCELIELCGAFGAAALAEVERALAAVEVPVGVVTYGVAATAGLHRLFVASDGSAST